MSFAIRILSALVVVFLSVKSSPSTRPVILFEALVNDSPLSLKLASFGDRASVRLLINAGDPPSVYPWRSCESAESLEVMEIAVAAPVSSAVKSNRVWVPSTTNDAVTPIFAAFTASLIPLTVLLELSSVIVAVLPDAAAKPVYDPLVASPA